jgi:hypothetical protein
LIGRHLKISVLVVSDLLTSATAEDGIASLLSVRI